MTRFILIMIASAATLAAPALAQERDYSNAGCATVTVSRATPADNAALLGDMDCFVAAARSALTSWELRAERLRANLRAPVPIDEPVPAPAPVTPTPAPSRTAIGLNLTNAAYYSMTRPFTNLAAGSGWQTISGGGWGDMPAGQIDRQGHLLRLLPGTEAALQLTQPLRRPGGTVVRCTWSGTGSLAVANARDVTAGARSTTFRMPTQFPERENVWLQLSATDPADPIRDIDCREPDAPAARVIEPAFAADVGRFAILRFMDWANTNGSPVATWAGRVAPGATTLIAGTGVPVEAMVDLIRQTPSDPWFTMSWNADADYIRRFATYVRDNVPADRTIHVEPSNEVWNSMFPAAQQAQREGVAAGLGADPFQSQLRRYSDRAAEILRIWTEVFAGQEARLVRVVAMQHANPWTSEQVLGHRDNARWFDALATAPYFGYDVFAGGRTDDLAVLFGRIAADMDATIALAKQQQAVATRFGKRYLTYEAGQHVTMPEHADQPLYARLQRDSRMGALYGDYLARWDRELGVPLVLFAHVGGPSVWGSWGLSDYQGQPLSEAPKAAAVAGFVGR